MHPLANNRTIRPAIPPYHRLKRPPRMLMPRSGLTICIFTESLPFLPFSFPRDNLLCSILFTRSRSLRKENEFSFDLWKLCYECWTLARFLSLNFGTTYIMQYRNIVEISFRDSILGIIYANIGLWKITTKYVKIRLAYVEFDINIITR